MRYTVSDIAKRLRTCVLGVSLAALIRGWRAGWRELYLVCKETVVAARLKEDPGLTRIPLVDLKEILHDHKPSIRVIVSSYEDGRLPYEQAIVLLSILVITDPAEVLEIGTFMGHTTRLMAENLPNSRIHTVDLPEGYDFNHGAECQSAKDDRHLIHARQVGREFQGQECAKRIVQHFGDTATWDFSQAGHPTFFFIDGSHSYDYCKNDSEKCWNLCRGKGVFLWHDLDEEHPGVIHLVSEWRDLGRNVVRVRGTSLGYCDGR